MTSSLRHALAVIAAIAGAAPACADEVVLVPARVIYPGETVVLAALKPVTLKPGRTAPLDMAVMAADLEGKVARKTLLPGRYVAAAALRQPWLVEQGASVQLVFNAGGLTISANAVTLQPGAAGDLVRVRNVDSGKVVSGTLLADGSVLVGAS